MLNNSLLSRKYLHREICNTIKKKKKKTPLESVEGSKQRRIVRDIRLPLYYRALNKKTSLWLGVKFSRILRLQLGGLKGARALKNYSLSSLRRRFPHKRQVSQHTKRKNQLGWKESFRCCLTYYITSDASVWMTQGFKSHDLSKTGVVKLRARLTDIDLTWPSWLATRLWLETDDSKTRFFFKLRVCILQPLFSDDIRKCVLFWNINRKHAQCTQSIDHMNINTWAAVMEAVS